jgi:hypothetical protein
MAKENVSMEQGRRLISCYCIILSVKFSNPIISFVFTRRQFNSKRRCVHPPRRLLRSRVVNNL